MTTLLTAKWTDRCSVKVKRSPGGEVVRIISHLRTSGSGTWEAMSGGVFGATGTGVGSVWTIIAHRVCVQDVRSLVTAGHRSFRRYQKKKMNIRSSRNILSWVWTIITDICTLKSFLKKVQQKKFEYFICNSDNPNFTPIILRKCHTLTHPL